MKLNRFLQETKESIVNFEAAEQTAIHSGNGLLSAQTIKNRLELEVDEAVRKFSERWRRGYLQLQNLYCLAKENDPELKLPFLEPDFFSSKEQALLTFGEEEAEDEMHELADVLGIDSAELSKAHDLVADLFDNERFEDAADALFFLSNLAPLIPNILVSLGQAEYAANHLEAAANCYSLAYMCDTSDPRPLIHAIYCLKNIGYTDEAKEYLDQLDFVAKQQDDPNLMEEAKILRDSLNKP